LVAARDCRKIAAVRAASWIFVLCAVLVGIGVFLPSLELPVDDRAVHKRTDLSLYKIASDRERARKLLAMYRASSKRRTGGHIARTLAPRVGGRARAALGDALDAMDTLDDVSDDDVRFAGIALIAALCVLLGLEALALVLVFGALMRAGPAPRDPARGRRYRRGRMVAAMIAQVAVTAIAVALFVVCREVVWQANDEVGRTVLVLGPGAYVLPVAAVIGFVAAIVLVARRSAPPALTAK
jgi:hypothetical protein